MSEEENIYQNVFEDGHTFGPLPDSAFGDRIQQTIMPIITMADNRPIPVGTGFMIGADGLMMTAAHVIHAAVEKGGRRLSPDGSFYDHQELYVLDVT